MKHRFTPGLPATLLLSLLLSGGAFAQIDLQQPLETQLNRQAIKANNIRSLTVYADFNEDGITTRGGYGGKLMEIGFDANGNQVYKATSNNAGNLPFLEYGRGTRISIDSADREGRKLSAYVENYRYAEHTLNAYDPDGNTISTTTIIDGDTLVKIGFTWSEGKMTQAKVLRSNAANKNVINDFNAEGKLTRHVSGNRRQEYSYRQSGDGVVTTVGTYLRDSLIRSETWSASGPSGQITRYVRTTPSGENEIEMKAEFDAAGNAVSWFLDDRTATGTEDAPIPVTTTIVNTYDSRQLLIKRLYFDAASASGMPVLTRIDRYCYDTEPLPYKLEKGALLQREMQENGGDR